MENMTEKKKISSAELADFCAACALEKKAENVLKIHVGPASSVADWFVISTANSEPQLRALKAHLLDTIAEHMASLPPADPKHPLLRYRDASPQLAGSWSVRLSGAGFHVSHIHPRGVLSSALYVSVPGELDRDAREGWLELGRPPAACGVGLEPLAQFEPQPGRLVLFPSYLFHGTRPFTRGERLSVAFDVTF